MEVLIDCKDLFFTYKRESFMESWLELLQNSSLLQLKPGIETELRGLSMNEYHSLEDFFSEVSSQYKLDEILSFVKKVYKKYNIVKPHDYLFR